MYISLSDSFYTPRSLDDWLKPLLLYKEAYDKAEEDYSTLLSQTEMWKDSANREKNPIAYSKYERYSTDLKNAADALSEGLNDGTRRSLLNLKGRFAKEIMPIAAADAAMKENKKLREEIRAKDPTVQFKYKINSLDQFLDGNTVDNTYISGDKLTAQTAARAQAISTAMFSDPKIQSIMAGNPIYQIMQQNGATPQELYEVLSNDPNANKYIKQVYDEMWDSVDASSYSAEGQRAIHGAISTGMHAILAKPTYQYQQNPGYTNPYQWASLNLQQRGQDIQEIHYGIKPYTTDLNGVQHYYDGRMYYTAMPITRDSNGYVKFIVKDGQTYDNKPEGSTVWVNPAFFGGLENIKTFLEKDGVALKLPPETSNSERVITKPEILSARRDTESSVPSLDPSQGE